MLTDILSTNGHDVFIDRRNLPYGEQWKSQLIELIKRCDVTVFCISLESVVSKWCIWELGEANRLNKKIIPIRLEITLAESIPTQISNIQILPYEGIFAMDSHTNMLLDVISIDQSWIKEHTRMSDYACVWAENFRNRDRLLRGAALEEAEQWLQNKSSRSPEPTAETTELIHVSRQHELTRLKKQQKVTIAVTTGAVALSLVAGIMAWYANVQSSRNIDLRIEAENQAKNTAERRGELLAVHAKEARNPLLASLILLEAWHERGVISAKSNIFDIFAGTLKSLKRPLNSEDIPVMDVTEARDYPSVAALLRRNLWQLSEISRLGEHHDHTHWAKSKSKDMIAMLSDNGTGNIIDLASNDSAIPLSLKDLGVDRIWSLDMSIDGQYVVASISGGRLVLWDATSGVILFDETFQGTVELVEFSNYSNFLALSTSEEKIVIASIDENQKSYPSSKTIKVHRVLETKHANFTRIAWGSSDATIYSGDELGNFTAWDIEKGTAIWRWKAPERINQYSEIVVSKNEKYVGVVYGSQDGLVVLDAKTGDVTYRAKTSIKPAARARAMAIDDSDDRLFWGGRVGDVHSVSLISGQEDKLQTCGSGHVEDISLSPDMSSIAVSTTEGRICVWNRVRDEFSFKYRIEEGMSVERIEWLGKYSEKIVGFSYNHPSRIFSLRSGGDAIKTMLACDIGGVLSRARLSPKENYLVAFSDTSGVCIWDLRSKDLVYQNDDLKLSASGYIFLKNGEGFVGTVNGRAAIYLFEDNDIHPYDELSGYFPGGVFFDLNGNYLIGVNRYSGSQMVSVEPSSVQIVFEDSLDIQIALATSNNEFEIIATLSEDGALGLWNSVSGNRLDPRNLLGLSNDYILIFFDERASDELILVDEAGAIDKIKIINETEMFEVPKDQTYADAEKAALAVNGLRVGDSWKFQAYDLASGQSVYESESFSFSRSEVVYSLKWGRAYKPVLRGANGGSYIEYRTLPREVTSTIPSYLVDFFDDPSILTVEQYRFIRLESQWRAFEMGTNLVSRCLDSEERKRLGLPEVPPCWCEEKSYPNMEHWLTSLNMNPFSADSSGAQPACELVSATMQ